jgi:hypothetical protein
MPSLRNDPDALNGRIFPRLYELLKGQPRLSVIARVDSLNCDEFFQRFVSAGYPVVIKGLLKSSETNQEYVISRLRDLAGHIVVDVRYGNFSDPKEYIQDRKIRKQTLKEYLAYMDERESSDVLQYLGNCALPDTVFEEMGISAPSYYSPLEFNSPRAWLGPRGAITPLHKDIVDNFALHIFGQKKWVIYPVRDFPYLYMTHPDANGLPDFATSQVDIRIPDYVKYPLFRKAQALEFIVEPGETLYLPAGWAHYVETTSDSFMINYWLKRERSPGFIERL